MELRIVLYLNNNCGSGSYQDLFFKCDPEKALFKFIKAFLMFKGINVLRQLKTRVNSARHLGII